MDTAVYAYVWTQLVMVERETDGLTDKEGER